MRLSQAEEQLMEFIWKSETAFMKDIMELYPEPKPASTTLATLLKRLQDKGAIGYQLFGNSRQYYPLVAKEEYFSRYLNNIVKKFFGDSALQFASFFTTAGNLSEKELEDLKNIVETEIQRRKK